MSTSEALAPHASAEPSAWVRRWSHLVAPNATVLDLACGSGRHVRWFAARGCLVTGVDRDESATRPLTAMAEIVIADLEGAPWPLVGRQFDAVIVTNYLWRERLAHVMACVADGGLLVYETFGIGNETVGKPTNPKFLLKSGELLHATQGLRTIAFEEGFEPQPPRVVQRIVAVRQDPSDARQARHQRQALVPF